MSSINLIHFAERAHNKEQEAVLYLC